MARRNKLMKFSDVLTFPNVVECFDPKEPKLTLNALEEIELKGKWKKAFFKNDNPLVLELACGRGEYSLALGRANPNVNYLGVDIKGARIWKGAKAALDEGLSNVCFLRSKIEIIDTFFESNEVDEIWITFPDPFHGKENRRLTAHAFLDRYSKFLVPNGIVHLKTDDDILFEFSVDRAKTYEKAKVIYENDDIYSNTLYSPDLAHKTYYELQHLAKGKTIKYLKFSLMK